jgi:putative ABC transport system permease protein
LALGAKPRDVLGMVLRQGLVLVLLGMAAGLARPFGSARYLSSMLFGLTAVDLLTYASVTLMFAAVAMVASYIPARRATKVDPLIALRYE